MNYKTNWLAKPNKKYRNIEDISYLVEEMVSRMDYLDRTKEDCNQELEDMKVLLIRLTRNIKKKVGENIYKKLYYHMFEVMLRTQKNKVTIKKLHKI